MEAAAGRLIKQLIRHADNGPTVRRFLTAHSIMGKVRIETFERTAKTTVTVSRTHGFGYLYMRTLYGISASQNIRMTAAPDALLPEFFEAINYPDDGVLVKIADDDVYEAGDIRVNCGRFIKNEPLRADRAKLRFSEKASDSLVDEALISLSDAGKTHGRIEEIYKSAMNFAGVSEAEKKLEAEIFG